MGSVLCSNYIFVVGVIRFRSANSEDRACSTFGTTDRTFKPKKPSDHVVVLACEAANTFRLRMNLGKCNPASGNNSLCDVLMPSLTSLLYPLVHV